MTKIMELKMNEYIFNLIDLFCWSYKYYAGVEADKPMLISEINLVSPN